MRLAFLVFLSVLFAKSGWSANLAYSTYLKEGFTPTAIASDSQGNLYLAGTVVTDPTSGVTGVLVAKMDPAASQFLYIDYLDAGGQDTVGGIYADGAGNLYVVGSTSNPNFAVTGTQFGTMPAGGADKRSFLTKLSANGSVAFSVLLGGSTSSSAEAVALTSQGQIVITGVSGATGFPTTQGAYSVSDSLARPFLVELDAAATALVFSATGIGGSSIALDASGNIYISGSTRALDYPTTAGAYQTTFTQALVCQYQPCETPGPGLQQYLTKVDPTGSRLIYSTGINDTSSPRYGSTINSGLAVDGAGNAYVTGTVTGPYPFTLGQPGTSPLQYIGFLTKIDPKGQSIMYSLAVGGGGIRLDSLGLYTVGTITATTVSARPLSAALGWVPSGCLRPGNDADGNVAYGSQVYAMKLDPQSGDVLDSQWIDGSQLTASAVTLAGGKFWVTGATQRADVPITPGALLASNITAGQLPGAYLSAVDFTQSLGQNPLIACVLDGADLAHTGPVAPNQILTLMGANLGPASGAAAPDGTDPSISGVTVTFDGTPAPLLYVSSSQINVVVPLPASGVRKSTVIQVSANGGASSPRQLPIVPSNLNLFLSFSAPTPPCPDSPGLVNALQPLAINSDGSMNLCTSPAPLGSIVSFFVEGTAEQYPSFMGQFGPLSAQIVNVAPVTKFVWKIDVLLPDSYPAVGPGVPALGKHTPVNFQISKGDNPIGPLTLTANSIAGGQPSPLVLWVAQ